MPRVIGDKVILREWLEEDLAEINWISDAEVTDNLSDTFLFPLTSQQIQNRMQKFIDGTSEEREFIIARKSDNKYLGQITFLFIDHKNQCGKIGLVIGDKNNHGKGYGKEALELLLQFAFMRLNLNRIELDVLDFNDIAKNLYSRCGFIVEGRQRERYYLHGKFHDRVQMAILKKEWVLQNTVK